MHLDAGYDYRPCREALEERGLRGEIAQRGIPAPIQVGRRWVVERANSWLNDFGKLRRCTETPPGLRRCTVGVQGAWGGGGKSTVLNLVAQRLEGWVTSSSSGWTRGSSTTARTSVGR